MADTNVPFVVDTHNEQRNFLMEQANSWLASASSNLEALKSFEIDYVRPAHFNFPSVSSPSFQAVTPPSAWEEPDAKFDIAPPVAPLLTNVDLTDLSAAQLPNEPDGFTPNMPTPPTLGSVPAPAAAPAIDDVEMPSYVASPLPQVPTLLSLSIPDAPDITLTGYDVDRPDFGDPLDHLYGNDYVRNNDESRASIFDLVESGMVQAELEAGLRDADGAKVRARLGGMLDGGTGLPAPIEQALFDRAITREDFNATKAVLEAEADWASRGFTLPGAAVMAAIREARTKNQEARSTLNREIMIQVHTQALENLRFVVQQGIQLEAQLFDRFFRTYQAAQQVADAAFNVTQAIFNARLEALRLQVSIYQSDITAFKERLQIELAKLEVYRSQLEGERVRGAINQQEVEIYKARLQGVLAEADVFKAQVEGANAQIRAQLSKVELFQGQIDAYKTSMEAEKIKFDVFDSQVRGEEARTNAYAALVRAYSERVGAYRAQVDAASTRVNATIEANRGQVAMYTAQVDAWGKGIEAEATRISSAARAFSAETERYNAELGAESARVQAETRGFEVAMEVGKADVAATLKQADQAISQLQHATTVASEILKTVAQVSSQLGASAMSALNISTSLSGSLSNAYNVHHTYTHSDD